MKAQELKTLSLTDLLEKHRELTKELIKDRAATATGTSPKNVANIKKNKRTIARIQQQLARRQTEEHTT